MSEHRSSDPVAAAYDQWSRTYDHDRNPTRDLDAAVLRRQPLDLADRDVLELGCGTGKNTTWLVEHARRVVALDISPGMLAAARARVPDDRARFVLHDLRDRWPLEDRSVDVVVGNLVLEHVEDLAPVFREAFRVLRPDGRAFFCELHPFRQLRGGAPSFEGPTGEVRIPTFLHDVSDFVDAALTAGLTLLRLGEWRDTDGAPRTDPPRLLSLLLRRPAP